MKRFLLFCLFCACINVSLNAQESLTGVDLVEDFPNRFIHCINHYFIYNNKIDYTKNDAPYPFMNGRIMSGKYKSSNAAFNEYLNLLKSYKDRKYKFVKTIKIKPVPEGIDREDFGLLFSHEEGDTLLYWFSVIASSTVEEGLEFISLDEINKLDSIVEESNKIFLNKQLVYLGPLQEFNEKDLTDLPLFRKDMYYTNKSNNMCIEKLPMKTNCLIPYSIWTVTNIQRIDKYIQCDLHNEKYGDYCRFGLSSVYLKTPSVDLETGEMNNEGNLFDYLYGGYFFLKDNICDYLHKLIEIPHISNKRIQEIHKILDDAIESQQKKSKKKKKEPEDLFEFLTWDDGLDEKYDGIKNTRTKLQSKLISLSTKARSVCFRNKIDFDKFYKEDTEYRSNDCSFPYLEDLLNHLEKEK